MTAKEYLQQIQTCDKNIDCKVAMIQSLRDRCCSITSSVCDVPRRSGPVDMLGNAIATISELEEEVNTEVDRFVALKREALALIQNNLDSTQANILYRKYFEYDILERIGHKLGISYRHVTRLHGKALKILNFALKCP